MKKVLCLDTDPIGDELWNIFEKIYEKRYTLTITTTIEEFHRELKKTVIKKYRVLLINFQHPSFQYYRSSDYQKFLSTIDVCDGVKLIAVTNNVCQKKSLEKAGAIVIYKVYDESQLVRHLRPGMGMKTEDYKLIIQTVCKYFDVPYALIMTNTRKREIIKARQISFYFLREFTPFSFKKIGTICDRRDHTTIMTARNIVIEELDTDTAYEQEVIELRKIIEREISKKAPG